FAPWSGAVVVKDTPMGCGVGVVGWVWHLSGQWLIVSSHRMLSPVSCWPWSSKASAVIVTGSLTAYGPSLSGISRIDGGECSVVTGTSTVALSVPLLTVRWATKLAAVP